MSEPLGTSHGRMGHDPALGRGVTQGERMVCDSINTLRLAFKARTFKTELR